MPRTSQRVPLPKKALVLRKVPATKVIGRPKHKDRLSKPPLHPLEPFRGVLPNDQRKRHPQKHDWAAASTTYIEGLQVGDDVRLLNMRELGDHFDIPYQMVRAKAAKERWNEQRAAYQAKMAVERRKKHMAKLAEESVEFDARGLQAAKLGQGIIVNRLVEITREIEDRRALRADAFARLKAGEAVQKHELYSAVRADEMMRLADALAKFNQVGHGALGMDITRLEISGPGGQAIEVEETVSIKEELMRDDPQRTAAILVALEQAGMLPKEALAPGHTRLELENTIDAEVIEDTADDDASVGEVVDDGTVNEGAEPQEETPPQQWEEDAAALKVKGAVYTPASL